MGPEKEQRWSFGTTRITGVKGLRLGQLGRGIGGLLGQQLENDHHGTVTAGRCCGSTGVAPGLACEILAG